MAGDTVVPCCTRLSVEALTPALARYPGLGEVRAIAWHSARPFAASGIVACAGGDVFVKRHDPHVRDVADLMEEHGFIAHLRRQGVTVPAVLNDASGMSATNADDGVYEVHALAAGQDRYRDARSWTPVRSLRDARHAGAALARLHRAASGFNAPARRTRMLVVGDFVSRAPDPVAAIEAWVAVDAQLGSALRNRDWRMDIARVLSPWFAARPAARAEAPCWVHGDFHVSNLLWQRGGVSAVLDFGLCNRASAIFDLATAIERNTIAWLAMASADGAIGHADLACALAEGYATILPAVELATLRALLPIVHVEFALSELAYFHAITRSAKNADLAYSDFLLGHAAWFATDHGQHFLDRLA